MFGLLVRFELREGHEEAFDRLVAETLGRIETEETATFAYVVHKVNDSPRSRVLVEYYDDREAFEQHEQEAHIRRFLTERKEHLHQEPEVWFISPQMGYVRDAVAFGSG